MTSTTRTAALIAALLATIFVIGCGDDESSSSDATDVTVDSTELSVSSVTDESTASSTDDIGEIDAIETTIKTWLLEGDCDLMTDKFLEDQTFISDPEKACQAFEGGFSPPVFGEDDIEITDVEYVNDKATAIVGGGGVDITSKYSLVLEDGTWKIDAANIQ